ncbi:hypothetical protein D3C71_1665440 [compost metagenome]
MNTTALPDSVKHAHYIGHPIANWPGKLAGQNSGKNPMMADEVLVTRLGVTMQRQLLGCVSNTLSRRVL